MSLTRAEKLQMLTEDLNRSIATGNKPLHDRTVAEFMNLQAQDAREKGDKLQLYILSCIEECNAQGMHGAQSLFTALALFQKFETLDDMCGVLAPTALALSEEIVRITNEYTSRAREENRNVQV